MTTDERKGTDAPQPAAAAGSEPPRSAAVEPRHISIVLAAYLRELRERAE